MGGLLKVQRIDQINDTTRRDLQALAEKYSFKVFGLKMWRDWKVTEGKNLGEACNFQVDYVFKNSDKKTVKAIIAKYNKLRDPNSFDSHLTNDCIDALSNLSLMGCVWA